MCLSDVRIVVGTRPQVIKLASLVKAFDSSGIDFSIIHTGQHYDFEMDQVFFDELGLPKPEKHLGVGSGSHAYQTGTMVIELEGALKDSKLVIVPGDTNSALAGALAAVKIGVGVAHVEAGLRSYLGYMPEEVNRVLVDHASNMLFAPTKAGYDNLLSEGIAQSTVHLTGDVMADNIVMLRDRIDETDLKADIDKRGYIFATVHRAENVDRPDNLSIVADVLAGLSKRHGRDVVFPVHPRTKRRLEEHGLWDGLAGSEGMHMIKPVSYLESLRLIRDADLVLTDSGGVQKEAFLLESPAVTLREATEWVETTESGWNAITWLDRVKIDEAVGRFLAHKPDRVDPLTFYGNGRASERIAGLVKERLAQDRP